MISKKINGDKSAQVWDNRFAMKYAAHIEGSQPKKLGSKITRAREAKGLSVYALAKLAGMYRSTLVDIESGSIRNPSPAFLAQIAEQVDLTLADLYPLAGYAVPQGLPDLEGYLAVRYRDLPADAVDEISGHLNYLQAKYGLDPAGPAPGADE